MSFRSAVVKVREGARLCCIGVRYWFLRYWYGMKIAPSARISFGARLDKTNPSGIVIGDESYVASGALILAHDYCRGIRTETKIGCRCFVGANAVVLAGVVVGDSVVIGAGAVVTKDVPSHCVVAGNPARIIRSGITTTGYGRIVETPGL